MTQRTGLSLINIDGDGEMLTESQCHFSLHNPAEFFPYSYKTSDILDWQRSDHLSHYDRRHQEDISPGFWS